jgi:hypothetical protein
VVDDFKDNSKGEWLKNHSVIRLKGFEAMELLSVHKELPGSGSLNGAMNDRTFPEEVREPDGLRKRELGGAFGS